MRIVAEEAITSTAAENTYYTDGSVDPQAPAAAEAVVAQDFRGSCGLSSNASILPAKLMVIFKALEESIQKEGHTTVYMDSKGSILALKARKPKENVTLIPSIKSVAKPHQAAGGRIVLNWIPSNVGIQGNEEADTLAKSALSHNTVRIKMQSSIIQQKEMARRYARLQEESEERWHYLQNSRTSMWYMDVTNFKPRDITMQPTRKLSVITHRIDPVMGCASQRLA
ncbi:uncharacterized protein [Macrobrachium rosenbergii]|uniref:uncharacterized protein n=1 Tax=Macrobrachium rosenbergii TaxID=79674 RepID=UPI0034D3FBE7